MELQHRFTLLIAQDTFPHDMSRKWTAEDFEQLDAATNPVDTANIEGNITSLSPVKKARSTMVLANCDWWGSAGKFPLTSRS